VRQLLQKRRLRTNLKTSRSSAKPATSFQFLKKRNSHPHGAGLPRAARLEGVAKPGAICLSEQACESASLLDPACTNRINDLARSFTRFMGTEMTSEQLAFKIAGQVVALEQNTVFDLRCRRSILSWVIGSLRGRPAQSSRRGGRGK
jgi:hypothetical protein